MQIPLDYYRILGLPTQSTPEQLQQAHRDRVLQLPRREYSEIAIASRRELLDEAYTTLADPALRDVYHRNTTRSQSAPRGGEDQPQSPIPTGIGLLDVPEHQVIGALLLLQELGEYELVLQVGIPLLPKKNFHPERSGESEIVHADTALTLALAYLELGREYWQQGHYESAAESLEAGQALLLKEGLFAGIRGEIKTDLYKLRPYRVLELLALPLEHVSDRRKGVQILRDMLQERGGIDGTGDDLSGLTIDDFLRFIQQLRDYLTAEEQQLLFETEARRPSAVATYLGVYALLARGFATYQPELIRRTKPLLVRLAKRQDVHLEQAISALLLGQTEQASRALEMSREYEAIVFIREHSQGSSDLLPGLCLYTEQWLRQDVFPHFRDLVDCKVTLKDYFSNAQVQQYLEALPQESAEQGEAWEVTGVSPLQGNPQGTFSPAPSRSPIGEATVSPRRLPPRVLRSSPPSTTLLPAEGSRSLEPGRRSSEVSPENHRSRRRSSLVRDDRRSSKAGFKVGPLMLVGLTGLLFIASLIFVGVNLAKWFSQPSTPDLAQSPPGSGLNVRLDQPILNLSPSPPLNSSASPVSTLTETSARSLVEAWLAAKSEAMGEGHNLAPLVNVLTGDALLGRQQEAEIAQREEYYVEYEHIVESIESLEIEGSEPAAETTSSFTQPSDDPLTPSNPLTASSPLNATPSASSPSPTQAIVIAVVNEAATFYQNGELDQISSYNAPGLRIRYDLEQVNGEWRIAEITSLP